jgi:hypothetical protein
VRIVFAVRPAFHRLSASVERRTIPELRGSSRQKRANRPWQARTSSARIAVSEPLAGNCESSVHLTTPVFLDSHYQSGLEGIVSQRMFWLVGVAVLLSVPVLARTFGYRYRRGRRRRNPSRRPRWSIPGSVFNGHRQDSNNAGRRSRMNLNHAFLSKSNLG